MLFACVCLPLNLCVRACVHSRSIQAFPSIRDVELHNVDLFCGRRAVSRAFARSGLSVAAHDIVMSAADASQPYMVGYEWESEQIVSDPNQSMIQFNGPVSLSPSPVLTTCPLFMGICLIRVDDQNKQCPFSGENLAPPPGQSSYQQAAKEATI